MPTAPQHVLYIRSDKVIIDLIKTCTDSCECNQLIGENIFSKISAKYNNFESHLDMAFSLRKKWSGTTLNIFSDRGEVLCETELLPLHNDENGELVLMHQKPLKLTDHKLIIHNTLDEVSSTIAHQVRGPLCTILGIVHLIELEGDVNKKLDLIKKIKASSMLLDQSSKELSKFIYNKLMAPDHNS